MKADISLSEKLHHHLSFWKYEIPGHGVLGQLHLDVLLVSAIVFFVISLVFYRVSLKLHLKPSFAQNCCEFCVDLVRKEIQGSCPHYVHMVGPLALSLFLAVLFMNALDVMPASLGGKIMGLFNDDLNFRLVPTADLNITMALAAFSFFAIQFKAIYVNGLGNYLKGWLAQPFGLAAFPLNVFSRFVEEVSRVFSLAMRLFGNILAGEIVFALLAFAPTWLKFPGVFAWCAFHLLIIYLQAFIFTMLVIVIFSLSLDH